MEPVGIYARVSTQEQATEDKASIPNQLRDCKELCERKGYQVIGDYVDAGHSSKSKDRPEYQRMIQDIKAGRIKGVVGWKWDRFGAGRGIYPLMDAIEEAGHSVTIETVHEGVISPLMLSMLTSFRAQVLKDQHDRLMSAGAARLEKGKAYGGYNRYGYDYDDDTWTLNEEESKWVRQIFEWYVSGVGVKEIRRRLITEKAPQKGKAKKRAWHEEVIRRILHNKAYTGVAVVTWGGVRYEIPCPAIISKATFQKAQERLAKNEKWRDRNKKLPYLLGGLLKCADCGNIWCCTGSRFRYDKGKRSERKTPLRRYGCKMGVNYPEECSCNRAINAALLEETVWAAILDYLRDPDRLMQDARERIERYRAEKEKARGNADRLRGRVERLKEERQWLITQARKETISQADFEAQIAMLNTEQTEAEQAYHEAIADIPDSEKLVTLEQLIETCTRGLLHELETLGRLELDDILTSAPVERRGRMTVFQKKRQLIETLINEVTIDPAAGTLYLHGTLERLVYFSTEKPQSLW